MEKTKSGTGDVNIGPQSKNVQKQTKGASLYREIRQECTMHCGIIQQI